MAKVTVMCGVQQGLVLTLHQPIDFGKGVVQARLINEPVVLKPGPNPGIDKAFFEAWKSQNKNLSVMPLITAEDEPESGQANPGAEGAASGGEKAMVDVDAMHRHVAELNRFKGRAEKVLAAYEASTGGAGSADLAAINERLDLVQHRMGDAEEAITSLQQSKDAGGAALLADQTAVQGQESAFGLRISAIEQQLSGASDMVLWFDQNREALAVLLTLGEAQPSDQAPPLPEASVAEVQPVAGVTIAGPIADGTGVASQAGSGAAPGTGGPDVANLADAAARGATGAPAAGPGPDAPAASQAGPDAALTAAAVIKDPTADPSTAS